ncbi:MAG: histidinol dehydrogenase [Bacteroidia bacterium]
MKTYFKPNKEKWDELIQRPLINNRDITTSVSSILLEVKQKGDQAIIDFAKRFDNVTLDAIEVSNSEIQNAVSSISQELKDAIEVAYHNIYNFHKAQQREEAAVETSNGVKCWRKSVPIDKVGLYIPGGTAPLFSTILMLAIPAKIAGCKEIVLCTPPSKSQTINPAILYAAQRVGVTKIFKVGGAQAVGALTYGTETIPKVYKIFGPGNQYVTKAKELVQQEGVAIDMPAGPSEVLVIADKTCNPIFVAADLLSQAEHGVDSQVILLSNDKETTDDCLNQVALQLEKLPRKETAKKALENSKAIIFDNIEKCIELSNIYAPEHLIIASDNATEYVDGITNAGSVFIGNYSCESAGDYASGTNHTLPTNGFAKNYSGVSLDSFVKKITYQQLSREGIKNIGSSIEIMAEAEQLFAHKNAVTVRLNFITNG